MIASCTLGEMMIAALARTICDGELVFHGFGSPMAQLAMHVAKRTHASRMALIAGATYGVDPAPSFLSPTTNDWVMNRGASASLDIEDLFDLAASGRLGRMFLSGLQIDRWGNCNVTSLGHPRMAMKLPGGGGGGNLSCDAQRVTLWTPAHRAEIDARGRRRFRLVEACDFITSFGHRDGAGRRRGDYGHCGGGPQFLVTELGLFDFAADGHMRLVALYPDTTADEAQENTGFSLASADRVEMIEPPTQAVVDLIRKMDPLRVHEKELRSADLERRFDIADARKELAS